MSPPSPAASAPAASASAARRLSTPPVLGRGGRGSPSGGGVCKNAAPHQRSSLGASARSTLAQQPQQLVQMNLDFGQSKLGMATCPGCGMVYSAGNQADAVRHARFHASATASTAATSRRSSGGGSSGAWRGQQVVKEFFNGDRIVRVTPADRVGWQRARDAFALMDQELGTGTEPETYSGMLVLLYVRHQAGIAGCCIAEPIRTAYRLLPPPAAARPAEEEDATALERSAEPQAAQCGIHKIWCRAGHRRSGVATALLDAARANLFLGLPAPLHLVAFTAPTPSGYRLACRYLRTDQPLVY